MEEAALEVSYHAHRLLEATTPREAAEQTVALANAISDLNTWLPGWDGESGTMPWERGEDT